MPQDPSIPDQRLGRFQPPLTELCCVDPLCPDSGQRGLGNLTVRTGKGRGLWRILRCSTCKAEFSERKGTALWGTKMAPEKVEAIAKHLKEGSGIRKTARLVGASKDGVTGIGIRLGLHGKAVHNERARGLKVDEAQLDEKWNFVEKKTKAL